MSRAIRDLVWSSTLLVASGCAKLIDVPEDPEVVVEEPWYCLGRPRDSLRPASDRVTIRVRPCNALDAGCTRELPELKARLCENGDIGCVQPLSAQTSLVEGVFELDAPTSATGFDGYLEITGPDAPCGSTRIFGAWAPALCAFAAGCKLSRLSDCRLPSYPQALLFFNPPVIEDFEVPLKLWLPSTPLLLDIIHAAGAVANPNEGSIIATTLDCNGAPATGIHYELRERQDQGTPLFITGGSVSDATSRTDASGIGGFVGVAPGAAEIVAYNLAQQRVGSVRVQVAPFGQTFVTVIPTLPLD